MMFSFLLPNIPYFGWKVVGVQDGEVYRFNVQGPEPRTSEPRTGCKSRPLVTGSHPLFIKEEVNYLEYWGIGVMD
jgi:hypothetical protein